MPDIIEPTATSSQNALACATRALAENAADPDASTRLATHR
jgi:hypothetical protein